MAGGGRVDVAVEVGRGPHRAVSRPARASFLPSARPPPGPGPHARGGGGARGSTSAMGFRGLRLGRTAHTGTATVGGARLEGLEGGPEPGLRLAWARGRKGVEATAAARVERGGRQGWRDLAMAVTLYRPRAGGAFDSKSYTLLVKVGRCQQCWPSSSGSSTRRGPRRSRRRVGKIGVSGANSGCQ